MTDLLARLGTKFLVGDDCWEWTAARDLGGYGVVSVEGRLQRAHRVIYEMFVGPIPEGLDLDHECHNNDAACAGGVCAHRRCVRPDHLTPVTRRENLLRGRTIPAEHASATHCPQGHPYDDENTYVNPNSGNRLCRECGRASSKAYYEARKATL